MVDLLIFLQVFKELILITLIIDVTEPTDREVILFGLPHLIEFKGSSD